MSDESDGNLDDAIAAGAPNDRTANQLKKDVHLVLAALQTDRVIMTPDNEARNAFEGVSDRFRALKRVTWLDPSREYDEVRVWLQGGK